MSIRFKRRYLVGIFIILAVSSIVILDLSYLQELEEATQSGPVSLNTPSIAKEKGVFARASMALEYANMPVDANHQKNLDTYYENRAYAGAPPTIPHEVLDEQGFGGKNCLQCHQNGGFVLRFSAYASVTPHPELVNCKQCHVPVKTTSLFSPSSFNGLNQNATGQQAMLGSPPIIPHEFQLRENCLACHAGPSVPKEIRVTHPERINCRQCHAAPTTKEIEWTRIPVENE